MDSKEGAKTTEAGLGVLTTAAIVFLLSALLYSVNLDRFPHFDELYHMLAAQGILEYGEPRIENGLYERAYWYTWGISRVFNVFGEGLAIARIPSVVAVAFLSALMYVWVRHMAGAGAALICSILFATSPFAVDTALFVRFYSFQALFFLSGAVFILLLTETSGIYRVFCAFGAMLALGAAVHLQPTTLIGVMGLVLWLFFYSVLPWFRAIVAIRRRIVLIVAICLLLILLAVFIESGSLYKLWEIYRSAPLFNQDRASEFWFYHVQYLKNYPTLWPAVMLLAIAALAFRPKLAGFAIAVFATSFIVSSFAASKNLRYIIYAQPFFFIICGIGLASFAAAVRNWVAETQGVVANHLQVVHGRMKGAALGLFTIASLFLVIGNPAIARSIAILADLEPKSNWQSVRADIVPWFDQVDVILTQSELEMLYYYGEYDLLYSPSRLGENLGSVDFDLDYRTGKPIVASFAAMELVFICYRKGIFVTSASRWGNPTYMPAKVAELISSNSTRITLPVASGMVAFKWWESDDDGLPAACEELPVFR